MAIWFLAASIICMGIAILHVNYSVAILRKEIFDLHRMFYEE